MSTESADFFGRRFGKKKKNVTDGGDGLSVTTQTPRDRGARPFVAYVSYATLTVPRNAITYDGFDGGFLASFDFKTSKSTVAADNGVMENRKLHETSRRTRLFDVNKRTRNKGSSGSQRFKNVFPTFDW